MKFFHSLATATAILTAVAAIPVSTVASGATAPAGTPTKKADAPAAGNAIVKLTRKQALPKSVKQLTIIDLDEGDKSAKPAASDNAVVVHYTGWLYDAAKPEGKGEKFESSIERGVPIGFFLDAGKVIKGWELGIVGMKPNGKRTLIIPPSLAYGERERPKIPANSTLIFDVALVDIAGTRDMKGSSVTSAAAPAAAAPSATQAVPAAPATLTIVRLAPQDALPAAPTQLTVIDEAPGEGPSAETGNPVLVQYTGWLYDPAQPGGKGKKFDSSRDRSQPFRFQLGAGRVIKGWDQGVAGMKVKGKRTLIIPAEYGYGERGAGGGLIPPGATLIFDVELVEIPPA